VGEKYGVVAKFDENQVEEIGTKPLRRTADVANIKRCPQCDAPLLETATRTAQCPNCGTSPFER